MLPSRSMFAPVAAGMAALLVAGLLAWFTWLQPDQKPADSVVAVQTGTVVNKAGGYSVQLPEGMKARRSGPLTRISDRGRALSVTIAPTTSGDPAATNRKVLRSMGTTYRSVILTTSERLQVDGHRAVASYGRATTAKGVQLRFVLVAVREKTRNVAISAFAAADADPERVLPRVRAITNGFHATR